jgi:hypothetical protein
VTPAGQAVPVKFVPVITTVTPPAALPVAGLTAVIVGAAANAGDACRANAVASRNAAMIPSLGIELKVRCIVHS